jgi:hypothetical protein
LPGHAGEFVKHAEFHRRSPHGAALRGAVGPA